MRESKESAAWLLVAFFVALALLPSRSIPVAVNVTRVTYVYEKDQGSVPPAVYAALEQINAKGVTASAVDKDTASAQFAKAVEAAKGHLPALVVESGETVLHIVESPRTLEQVLEAAGL